MPRERRPQSKFKGQSFFKDEGLDNGGDLKGQPGSPSSKKRRPTNIQPQASPSLPDLVPPPPLTGYGETIVASNPFDDSLQQSCNHPSMGGVLPTGGAGGGSHQQQHQGSLPPPMHNPVVGPNPAAAAAMHAKPVPMSSGKIYPPDQPMVFNPQNPNAPPIYPCGICHKEVHDNDQAILCESGCNFWFHRICTGLTEAAYHLLTAEVYAEWVCDKCLQSKNIPLVKFKP